MPKKGEKNYFAVIKGEVDVPTIFTSWATVHPLVTGHKGSNFKSFATLSDARAHMKSELKTSPWEERLDPIPQSVAEPQRPGDTLYYAIASGRERGCIKEAWFGQNNAEALVKRHRGNCHQKFRTRPEAERFIREWNASFCLVATRLLTRCLGGELAWAEVQGRLMGLLGLPDGGAPAAPDADGVACDLEKMSI